MYVIYNEKQGFYCEDEDIVGGGHDFELDDYTVYFEDIETARLNAHEGEFVLKVCDYKLF